MAVVVISGAPEKVSTARLLLIRHGISFSNSSVLQGHDEGPQTNKQSPRGRPQRSCRFVWFGPRCMRGVRVMMLPLAYSGRGVGNCVAGKACREKSAVKEKTTVLPKKTSTNSSRLRISTKCREKNQAHVLNEHTKAALTVVRATTTSPDDHGTLGFSCTRF